MGNISAKKYQNVFKIVKVIAKQRWDVFLRHSVDDAVILFACLDQAVVRYWTLCVMESWLSMLTSRTTVRAFRLYTWHVICIHALMIWWLFGLAIVTFCVSRRRRKMYCGHARLCVCVCVSICLSAAVRPYYCTDPDVTWRRGRGCPLVVHYWADLQSVHGLRCYGNITRTPVTSLRPSRDMTT